MDTITKASKLPRFVREAREVVTMNRPEVAGSYFQKHIFCPFEDFEQEEMWGLMLDSRQQVKHEIMIFRGTVNSIHIRPADLFREAVRLNAVSLILAHNHPSGEVEPSTDDIQITARLCQAATLLDIGLNDHLVVGKDKWVSLRERGHMG